MKKLTAIVVDDELESREGLKQIIPWKQLGYSVILEASNGKQALDMIGEYLPDLIFTDLVMPFLDGLHFMDELQRRHYPGKVIVITGHDEFTFARDALRFGAYDYVLKPFSTHEILPIVSQCTDEIRLGMLAEMEKCREKENFSEALKLLQEKTVLEMLSGSMRHRERTLQKLAQFSLDWMLELPLTVGVLEIDNMKTLYNEHSIKEKDLLLFATGNVTQETLSSHFPVFVVPFSADRLLLVLGSDNRKVITGMMRDLLHNIQHFVKLPVSIGIGQSGGLGDFPYSYIQASEALEYKTVLGGNKILFSDEVNLNPSRMEIQDSLIEQELLSVMKTGAIASREEFRGKLESLVHSWGIRQKEDLLQKWLEWLLKMERQLQHLTSERLIVSQHTLLHWRQLNKFDTMDKIVEYGMERLEDIVSEVHRIQSNQLNLITKQALDKIRTENLQNITLSSIAEKVYVSPVWLSHLIKENTGKTFLGLVTEYRIEKSKELLKDISLKAYEVADQVGYRDTDYFSKIFKKHTGMTPTEYRNTCST